MTEPERIERDGVVYVPQLWLQSGRDALDTACAQIERLEAAGDALTAIVDRTARVANLPEERAAVAAWRAARGEGGQGHIWRNGDA